jgi:hypothetical protein
MTAIFNKENMDLYRKWDRTGLLDEFTDVEKVIMAMLCENRAKYLMSHQSAVTHGVTRLSDRLDASKYVNLR